LNYEPGNSDIKEREIEPNWHYHFWNPVAEWPMRSVSESCVEI
jgi:hypothetical protein